ncbi:AMP-binding protein [Hymenobacter psychrotolerans]|uniref:Acyl-coenzyme A synthetase/AMP-(Fatty) acid ligase n=1 Tax=Hymenobacter psychrotolerans DSM 18569 TaxID=1121959 RepID=A0A1M6SVR5_9BACT|nr:AMP-binding protein [Hymenobacter psychrotolerans]SHK48804.1 Acyl-coenzyme A synthetase/AMP-(fatty) acid ligase [Hymenobacter psychrotolerans DSM 18569]
MKPATSYAAAHAASLADPDAFWAGEARQLTWFREPPRPVLSQDPATGFYRWFRGGQLNTAWLCLDYHVQNGRAEQPALLYDSPVTGTRRAYTYRELLDLTARCAGGLRELGVAKGDRVIVYMPNMPEAVVAMLACARLGAVHSVVFGGFAPPELAIRIDDARPRVLICASAGMEFDKPVPYKPLVEAAVAQATHKPDYVVVAQRDFCLADLRPHPTNDHRLSSEDNRIGSEDNRIGSEDNQIGSEDNRIGSEDNQTSSKDNRICSEDHPTTSEDQPLSSEDQPLSSEDNRTGTRDVDFRELLQAAPVEAVPLDATDPLYILYTSGTTGKPKGVVRDNGGHAVALKYSMSAIYGLEPGETLFTGSDIGWAVGHSYIVYGPLLHGCTTILFEGKPVRTPDAGTFWRLLAEYKARVMFTAPTAIRAIKKEDPDGELVRRYDLRHLRCLFLAGERCDPATYEWAGHTLGVPVIDHWWQTESGWPMLATLTGLADMPAPLAGSAGFPVPGYDVQILDEAGQPVPAGTTGLVAVRLPLPPGCLPTLWQDDARFQRGYLDTFPGYYLSGDGGYRAPSGHLFIMGRVDDVINVAGHRFSTGEMEEILAAHPAVAECAVLGIACELRGQRPVGLVVLKDGQKVGEEQLEQELIGQIRSHIGAVASFRQAAVVKRLPKTRSGKILRKTLRQLADGEQFTVPSTIDDPAILTEIGAVFGRRGIGQAFEQPNLSS